MDERHVEEKRITSTLSVQNDASLRLDVTIRLDEADLHAQLRAITKKLVGEWGDLRDDDIDIVQLPGGITNSIFKLTIKEACQAEGLLRSALCRIYGNRTEKLIDRADELMLIQHLHRFGRCAPLYGCFVNGFIIGFVPGRSLEPHEMRDHISLIAEELARWHRIPKSLPDAGPHAPQLLQPQPQPQPQPTQQQQPAEDTTVVAIRLRSWIDLVPASYASEEKQKSFSRISLPQVRIEIESVLAEYARRRADVVFCHNDLLSGNVIVNNSANGDLSVTFIDYDYCGMCYASFDLGNHFNEYAGFELNYTAQGATADQKREFVRVYLTALTGHAPTESELAHCLDEVALGCQASHLFWGTWALVQAEISSIDFPFCEYGVKRLEEYFRNKPISP